MNYKGAVQEFCHKNHLALPEYQTYQYSGSSHNPIFYCDIKVQTSDRSLNFQGIGVNKKAAETNAAKICYENLEQETRKTTIDETKVMFIDLENQGANLSLFNQTGCKIYGFASSSHPVLRSKDINNMEIFAVDSSKRDAADLLLVAKFVQLFDENWRECYIVSSDHFAQSFLDCLKVVFPKTKVPVKVLKNYGDYLDL